MHERGYSSGASYGAQGPGPRFLRDFSLHAPPEHRPPDIRPSHEVLRGSG